MSTPFSTLLIGGAGYIGARLARELVASGRQVTVLGRHAAPRHALPDGAAYRQGDFGDAAVLSSLLAQHAEVVHLAHASVPSAAGGDPLADLQQNLAPALQLFAESARRDVKLLLLSSGGTVYGEALSLPIAELHPTRPVSSYGVLKLALESYARLYAVTHGLQVVCVRPANAYGPGQRPFTGQGFVSTALASAMRGQPVAIFGADGAVRDYVYIDDIASGLAAALQSGQPGQTYNLGSGEGRSNREVLEAMAPLLRELGHTLRVEHLPERPSDVKANVLDAGRLRADTGWAPRVAFDAGLRLTANWLLEPADA